LRHAVAQSYLEVFSLPNIADAFKAQQLDECLIALPCGSRTLGFKVT
jgi:hypothetical protein